MKNFKRILSMILTLSIMIGLVNIPADIFSFSAEGESGRDLTNFNIDGDSTTINNIKLSYYDGSSWVSIADGTQEYTFNAGEYKIEGKWVLPQGATIQNGDYIDISVYIGGNVSIDGLGAEYPFYANGTLLGYISFNKGSSSSEYYIRIKFVKEYSKQNINGSFEVQFGYTPNVQHEGGWAIGGTKHVVKGNTGDPTVPPPTGTPGTGGNSGINPVPKPVEKTGKIVQGTDGTKYIQWVIILNAQGDPNYAKSEGGGEGGGEGDTDLIITDTLGDGQILNEWIGSNGTPENKSGDGWFDKDGSLANDTQYKIFAVDLSVRDKNELGSYALVTELAAMGYNQEMGSAAIPLIAGDVTSIASNGTGFTMKVQNTVVNGEKFDGTGKALVISYFSKITNTTLQSFNNSVEVEGSTKYTTEPSIKTREVGGSVDESTSGFTIKKASNDSPPVPLENAVFEVKWTDATNNERTATLTTNAEGTAVFEDITNNGAYGPIKKSTVFEVRETTAPAGYVKPADSVWYFKINPSDYYKIEILNSGSYLSSPNANIANNCLVITNEPLTDRITINAQKHVEGEQTLSAGKFSFTITENDSGDSSKIDGHNKKVYNDNSGLVNFGTFTYDARDYSDGEKLYYLIKEDVPSPNPENGWSYDNTEYLVEVTISKDENAGTFSATITNVQSRTTGTDNWGNGTTPDLPNSVTLNFTNTYSATGDWTPEITKGVVNKGAAADAFEFKIYSYGKSDTPPTVFTGNGTEIATATNVATGAGGSNSVSISAPTTGGTYDGFKVNEGQTGYDWNLITFNKAGTYYFKIVETTLPAGWTANYAAYYVEVDVTDNGEGVLTAEAKYYTNETLTDTSSNSAAFVNTYNASGTLGLCVKKTVVGATENFPAFNFEFYTATKENEKYSFDESNYISAVSADPQPSSPDTKVLGTITYDSNDDNGYFDGWTDDGDGTRTTTVYYAIKETQPEEDGWKTGYDKTIYYVEVLLTDNGDGTITPTVEGVYKNGVGDNLADASDSTINGTETNPFTFINKYEQTGTWTPIVQKKTTGSQIPADKSFEFKIYHNNIHIATATASGTDTPTGGDPYTYSLKFEPENGYGTEENRGWYIDTNGNFIFTKTANDLVFTIEETDPGLPSEGWTYDTAVYTVTVNVANGTGNGMFNVTATFKKTGGSGSETDNSDSPIVFNNEYKANPITWTPQVTKTTVNRDMSVNTFTFTLEEADSSFDAIGDFSATATTTTQSAMKQENIGFTGTETTTGLQNNSTFTDGVFSYTKTGTYYYIITETNGTGSGWAVDGVKKVTVVVADNGIGNLYIESVTVATEDSDDVVSNNSENLTTFTPAPVEITNTYTATGTWTPEILKKTIGHAMDAGFEFTLHDVTLADNTFTVGNQIGTKSTTATTDTTETIIFDEVNFVFPYSGSMSEYIRYFAIMETAGTGTWDYDTTVYIIGVEATDKGDGTITTKVVEIYKYDDSTDIYTKETSILTPETTITNGDLTAHVIFENKFFYKVKVNLGVEKEYEGKTATATDAAYFTFTAYDITDAVDIKEFNGVYEGEFKDYINRTLNADFLTKLFGENEDGYKSFKGKIDPTDTKKVIFDDLEYKVYEDETRIFIVVEDDYDSNGWTSDPTVYLLTVEVNYDDTTGTATVGTKTVQKLGESDWENADTATFTNTYEAVGEWNPSAQKTTEGKTAAADEFKFELYGPYTSETTEINGTPIAYGKNETSGKVVFYKENNYSTPYKAEYKKTTTTFQTTYYYIMKEVVPTETNGWTFDDTLRIIKVELTDNGAGVLTETVSVKKLGDATFTTDNPITFANTYSASGGWSPKITKTAVGNTITANLFTFELYEVTESDGNYTLSTTPLRTASTKANSSLVEFTEISYKFIDVGETFVYAIVEKPDANLVNWTMDNSIYFVTVKIVDDGKGGLSAEVQSITKTTVSSGSYGTNGLTDVYTTSGSETFTKLEDYVKFENKYSAEFDWKLEASKKVTGKTIADVKETIRFRFVQIDDSSIAGKTLTSGGENSVKFTDSEFKIDQALTIGDNGNFGFNYTFKTEEGWVLNETYYFVLYESTGMPGNGWENDTSVYLYEITLKDSGLVVKVLKYAVDGGKIGSYGQHIYNDPVFTNNYKLEGEWTPSATKTVESGVTLPSGFEFYLYEMDSDPTTSLTSNFSDFVSDLLADSTKTPLQTKQNDPAGTIPFDAIKYSLEGEDLLESLKTYYYVLFEEVLVANDNNGWVSDPAVYLYAITLSDDNGTLGIAETITMFTNEGSTILDAVTFKNTHENSATWTPSIKKTLKGSTTLSDGVAFTFDLYETDESYGIDLSNPIETIQVNNSNVGEVLPFASIGFEAGDFNGGNTLTRYYVIREKPKTGTENPGWTYDTAVYKIELTATFDGNSGVISTPTVTVNGDPYYGLHFEFTNEYEAVGGIDLGLAKTIIMDWNNIPDIDGSNSANSDYGFTFNYIELTSDAYGYFDSYLDAKNYIKDDSHKASERIKSSIIEKVISFNDEITYERNASKNDVGVHYYLIYEVDPGEINSPFVFDKTVYIVTVEVEDDNKGNLIAKVTEVKKFSEDGSSDISEDAIDNDGKLVYEKVLFTNRYEVKGNIDLKIGKTSENKEFDAGVFEFEVHKVEISDNNFVLGDLIETAKNTKSLNKIADATFGLDFEYKPLTEDDLWENHTKKVYYAISEKSGVDNWEIDDKVYIVELTLKHSFFYDEAISERIQYLVGVQVTAIYAFEPDGEGQYDYSINDKENLLEEPLTVGNGDLTNYIEFENTYYATGEWTPEATKTAVGADIPEENGFEFYIYDVTGENLDKTFIESLSSQTVVSKGTVGTNGVVNFLAISYDTREENGIGTYTYLMIEKEINNNGWTSDNTVYKLIVTVSDISGTLTATISEISKLGSYIEGDSAWIKTQNGAVFTNTYTAEGQWTPTATKSAVGRDITDEDLDNITFDFKIHEIEEDDVEGLINGLPVLTESTLIEKVSNIGTDITFDEIKYIKNGTVDEAYVHYYVLFESTTDGNGWTTDKSFYLIEVDVVDDGEGKLETTATVTKYEFDEEAEENAYLPNDDITSIEFSNTYSAGNSWSPKVTKTTVNKNMTADQFEFIMYATNEEFIELTGENAYSETAANDEFGQVIFEPITFDESLPDGDNKFYFTIKEEIDAIAEENGWTYDSTIYYITLTVKHDGNGNISITEDIQTEIDGEEAVSIEFTNIYTAEGSLDISFTKNTENRTLENTTFTFALYEAAYLVGNGKTLTAEEMKDVIGDDEIDVISTVSSDLTSQDLVFELDYDVYDLSQDPEIDDIGRGTKHYVLIETSTDGLGWTTDKSVYLIEVSLEDDGEGTIGTAIKNIRKFEFDEEENVFIEVDEEIEVDEISFTNSYNSSSDDWTPQITKTTVNKDMTAGQFEFTMYATDEDFVAITGEDVYSETAANANPGNSEIITFPTISYDFDDLTDGEGTFYYVIKETTEDGNGWTGDGVEYHITVTATDNGEGGINIDFDFVKFDGEEESEAEPSLPFVNTYNATGEWTPEATKVIAINPLNVGAGSYINLEEFEFNFALYQTGATFSTTGLTPIDTATNNANGLVSFDEIVYDISSSTQGVGTYYYVMAETTESGDGWTVGGEIYRFTVTVTDDDEGNLDVSVLVTDGNNVVVKPAEDEYDEEDISFTNTYSESGNIQFTVNKTTVGHVVENNMFIFNMFAAYPVAGSNRLSQYEQGESGFRVWQATVAVTGSQYSATAAFDSITYTTPGTYYYIIKEVPAAQSSNWTFDTREYHITVTVTSNRAGTLGTNVSIRVFNAQGVEINPGSNLTLNDINYTNTYVENGTWTPQVRKTANVTIPQGMFSFAIYNATYNASTSTYSYSNSTSNRIGSPVSNTATGTNIIVSFPAINYNEIGTHHYAIVETTTDGNNWTTDRTVYYVTVSMVNQNGTLVPVIERISRNNTIITNGTMNDVVFNNTYDAPSTSLQVRATKQATGATLQSGQFSFALTDSSTGQTVAYGTNDASGNITFNAIYYTEPGTYQYTMRETSQSGGGWTTDSSVYNVFVTVTRNSNGTLTATQNTSQGSLIFRNTYTQVSTSINLTANKTAVGGTLTDGQFSFAVVDSSGNTVATGTNNASGVINFSTITYNSAGTYTYTMRETSTSGNGWTTDSTTYSVTVTVTQNANGTLTATQTTSASSLVFRNTYSQSSTSINLTANKTAIGGTLSYGQFSFAVIGNNGSTVATGTNDANGNITFSAIEYSEPGTYQYTMIETSQGGNGWTTDDSTYNVTVTVTQNANGTLSAQVTSGGSPTFINFYDEDEEEFENNFEDFEDFEDFIDNNFEEIEEEETEISLVLNKVLVDEFGDLIGTGKKFAIQILDSRGNLLRRVIVSANEGSVTVNGLTSDSLYFIAEEIGSYTTEGFDVDEYGSVTSSTFAISTPQVGAGNQLTINVTARNMVTADEVDFLPDDDVPLGAIDFEDYEILDVPPPTSDSGIPTHYVMFGVSGLALIGVALFLVISGKSKKKNSKSGE